METVKVYLNGSEEIRKFKWSFNEGFKALEKKIYEVFSLLDGKSIKIRWKDEENEYIDISSDAELTLMLSQQAETKNGSSTGVSNKLYVLHCQQPRDGDYIHENVECDSCHLKNMRGNRFKCLECRNFDLCEPCFSRGEHKQHDMAVLRSSGGMGFNLASRISRRLLGLGSSTAGFTGACGPPASRPMSSTKRAAIDEGDQFSLTSFQSTNMETSFCGMQPQQPSNSRDMKDVMKDLDSFSSRSTGVSFGANDYDSMGRFITEILNERGLHCSYSVENSPHNTNEGTREGNDMNSQLMSHSNITPTGEPAPSKELKGLTYKMETCSINSDSYSIVDASEVAELPKVSTQNFIGNPHSKGIPFFHSHSATKKNSLQQSPPIHSTTEFHTVPSSGVSTPLPTTTYRPPLPRNIENSRAQMLSMGFTDENGWLSDLLTMHDGDISKSLDEIQRRTSGR